MVEPCIRSCDINPEHQFQLGSWADNQYILSVLDGKCLTWQGTGMQGMFAGRGVSLEVRDYGQRPCIEYLPAMS